MTHAPKKEHRRRHERKKEAKEKTTNQSAVDDISLVQCFKDLLSPPSEHLEKGIRRGRHGGLLPSIYQGSLLFFYFPKKEENRRDECLFSSPRVALTKFPGASFVSVCLDAGTFQKARSWLALTDT